MRRVTTPGTLINAFKCICAINWRYDALNGRRSFQREKRDLADVTDVVADGQVADAHVDLRADALVVCRQQKESKKDRRDAFGHKNTTKDKEN